MRKGLAGMFAMALMMTLSACGQSSQKPETIAVSKQEGQAESQDASAWTPKGDITIYCPYAAGGATDLCLRCIAEILSSQTGQNVNVVNREGGGGVVGTTQFKMEKPDGYSIAMISNSQFSTQPFLREVEYTIDDFIPFIGLNLEPNLLVVPYDAPYDTIEEFVAYFKDRPDETITYGHSGNGGIGHLTQTFFLKNAGLTKNESIPYSGNAEAITALLGGHITMCTANYVEATALFENKSAKALALIAKERSVKDAYKAIPTLRECGYDVDLTIFKFLALPADTPEEIVEFWQGALEEAYQDEKWINFAANYNLEECTDWTRQDIMDRLLPEIEETHKLLQDVGLAVN